MDIRRYFFLLALFVVMDATSEVSIYYDDQIQSSIWLPFPLNCTDEVGVGNGCQRRNPFYTKITKNDPAFLDCRRKCPDTNLSVAQKIIPNPLSAFIFVYAHASPTCSFKHPEKEGFFNGITTTIHYKYYTHPLFWNNNYAHIVNCSLTGIYNGSTWTEERRFQRLGMYTRTLEGGEILVIVLASILLPLIILGIVFLVIAGILRSSARYHSKNNVETI